VNSYRDGGPTGPKVREGLLGCFSCF